MFNQLTKGSKETIINTQKINQNAKLTENPPPTQKLKQKTLQN